MTKVCERCEKELHTMQFCMDRSSEDGLGPYCRTCRKDQRQLRGYKNRKKRREGKYRTPALIVCCTCHREQPATEFHRSEDSKTGRAAKCKGCISAWADYQRRREVARKEAERLYVAQNKIYAPKKRGGKKKNG